jgi:hypothetical protein
MKRIGVIEENEWMRPVQRSMSMPADRNNNADQARTPGWQSSALRRRRTPARAGGVEREAAVVAGGRNRDRLYFSVNSDDAIAIAAVQAAADGNAPERDACIFLLIPRNDVPVRDACISLLIPGSRSFRRPPNRPRGDGPERGGPYFSVNSRNDSPSAARMRVVADRCRFRRMLRLPKPDRHCKNLQIVADTHAAAVGPSSASEAFLLREIAAAA